MTTLRDRLVKIGARICQGPAGELCPVGAPEVPASTDTARNERHTARFQALGTSKPLTEEPKWQKLLTERRSYGNVGSCDSTSSDHALAGRDRRRSARPSRPNPLASKANELGSGTGVAAACTRVISNKSSGFSEPCTCGPFTTRQKMLQIRP
jgi:hypothetical protein